MAVTGRGVVHQDEDDEDHELYNLNVPRVDAVAGPAHGIPFHILKAQGLGPLTQEQRSMAARLTGRPAPVTKGMEDPPLPAGIEQLLEQLVAAYSHWQDGIDPLGAAADDDAPGPVEKSISRRYDRMVAQMPPAIAGSVQSAVAHAALRLTLAGQPRPGRVQKAQTVSGISAGDAKEICQRVALDLAAAHARQQRGRR